MTPDQGMKRFHARVAVVKALQDAGLYIETKDNPMQIPLCRYVDVGSFAGQRFVYSSNHDALVNPVISSNLYLNLNGG